MTVDRLVSCEGLDEEGVLKVIISVMVVREGVVEVVVLLTTGLVIVDRLVIAGDVDEEGVVKVCNFETEGLCCKDAVELGVVRLKGWDVVVLNVDE